MTGRVLRHPAGDRKGGQFAPKPAAAVAAVTAPGITREWDVQLWRDYCLHIRARSVVRADDTLGALEAARAVLVGSLYPWAPDPDRPDVAVEHDTTGRDWHTAKVASGARGSRVAVSPVGCDARNSTEPFTSAAGGFEAKIEYQRHTNSRWCYTASEERANLAAGPHTNIIAQTERQRIALGQACAELMNDGRLTRKSRLTREGRLTRLYLGSFYETLIRSTENPYKPPTWGADPDLLLLAFARAGCAAPIAATLHGNDYTPQRWANRNKIDIFGTVNEYFNVSGLPLGVWRCFKPLPATLTEAAETAPRTSTPADGTLLGTALMNPGADPDMDCLGAWAAETVQLQKQLFTYGIAGIAGHGLAEMPLSIISRSPEKVRDKFHGEYSGRIPVGVVEALLYANSAKGFGHPSYAPVQAAAARRSELAAHLALGGLHPVHDSALDALLDDPRNDWCETSSEFRRKIVTAALTQTAGSLRLNSRADQLIAEHVIGGPSDDVTDIEMRCVRTLLTHLYYLALDRPDLGRSPLADEGDTYAYQDLHRDATNTISERAGSASVAVAFPRGSFPQTAARLSARLRRYARTVNRRRRLSPEAASDARQFLQTLLTVSDIPPRQRAELYVLERVVCADYCAQTAAG